MQNRSSFFFLFFFFFFAYPDSDTLKASKMHKIAPINQLLFKDFLTDKDNFPHYSKT